MYPHKNEYLMLQYDEKCKKNNNKCIFINIMLCFVIRNEQIKKLWNFSFKNHFRSGSLHFCGCKLSVFF